MKKLFIALFAMFFAVSVVSATDSTEKTLPVKGKSIVKNEKEKSVKKGESEKTLCTVSCSMTHNGITYTTTGGNWLSSCERASRRCAEKLRKYVLDAEVVYN